MIRDAFVLFSRDDAWWWCSPFAKHPTYPPPPPLHPLPERRRLALRSPFHLTRKWQWRVLLSGPGYIRRRRRWCSFPLNGAAFRPCTTPPSPRLLIDRFRSDVTSMVASSVVSPPHPQPTNPQNHHAYPPHIAPTRVRTLHPTEPPPPSQGAPLRYEMGRSKVYFRKGALEHLESLRLEERSSRVTVLQAVARMFPRKKRYRDLREGAVRAQAEWRRVAERRRFLTARGRVIRAQVRCASRGRGLFCFVFFFF